MVVDKFVRICQEIKVVEFARMSASLHKSMVKALTNERT